MTLREQIWRNLRRMATEPDTSNQVAWARQVDELIQIELSELRAPRRRLGDVRLGAPRRFGKLASLRGAMKDVDVAICVTRDPLIWSPSKGTPSMKHTVKLIAICSLLAACAPLAEDYPLDDAGATARAIPAVLAEYDCRDSSELPAFFVTLDLGETYACYSEQRPPCRAFGDLTEVTTYDCSGAELGATR